MAGGWGENQLCDGAAEAAEGGADAEGGEGSAEDRSTAETYEARCARQLVSWLNATVLRTPIQQFPEDMADNAGKVMKRNEL